MFDALSLFEWGLLGGGFCAALMVVAEVVHYLA